MEQKNDRVLKLQKWVVENYEDWCTICGMGKYPISEQEFMRLGDTLVSMDFEEMTLVLLQCHYYAVQDRAEKRMRFVAETCRDELSKRGLNLDELLPFDP